MLFFSLIKLIFLFIFIYFILSLVKMVLRINSALKNKNPGKDPRGNPGENPRDHSNGNMETGKKGKGVIELDKDQYKVE